MDFIKKVPGFLFNLGKSIFGFFNLLDKGNKLSITNVAVIVCVVKVAIAPEASVVDVGALMISILSYMHKRHEGSKLEASSKDNEVLDAINAKQQELTTSIEEIKLANEDIHKQAQETKRLLNGVNMDTALNLSRKR